MRGVVNHFNRGEVEDAALAREDLKRVNNSASYMRNFIPSRLGTMSYRPGMELVTELFGQVPYMIPFVSSITDTSIVIMESYQCSFMNNGVIATSSAVTTTITNQYFTTDLSGWTVTPPVGTETVTWQAEKANLKGDGNNKAILYQTVTAQTGVEHSLQIKIDEAPANVRIGYNGQSSFEIFEGILKPGRHVLSFTPTANFTITFENDKKYSALIDQAVLLGNGRIILPTPIPSSYYKSIRYVQSIDVIFIAFGGKPIQIEKRGDKSWSVVDYRADDGPFDFINDTSTRLKVLNLSGNSMLAANENFFSANDIGRLYKLSSQGQIVEATVSSNVSGGSGTSSVKVTGIGSSRKIYIDATIPAGTVTLQRSYDNIAWSDIGVAYTTNQTNTSYDDGLDNAIVYYRLWVKPANWVSGSIILKLTYPNGSIDGICRVTNYTSEQIVNVQILKEFGSLDYTRDWYAGVWYENNYPTANDIYEGRLWLGGKDKIWGSVSDAYYSYDSSIEGNSQAISKTIGFGTIDPIKWLKSGTRLVIGKDMNELSIRSSNYGEVITQSNANIKSGTNQGSDNSDTIIIDDVIYFIHRSGISLYALKTFVDSDNIQTIDVNLLNKEITNPGIVRIAFARQPETRIFCVLEDGTVAIQTIDELEEVSAWSRFTTTGLIKDVIVLPEKKEDRVYFVVDRQINSSYSLEKLQFFDNTEYKSLDSSKSYINTSSTITGLSHLEGTEVCVYGDGLKYGPYTVNSGSITTGQTFLEATVGQDYSAKYISNKLSGYRNETVLTERKRLLDTGLCLMNYYHDSITIGADKDHLRPMPSIEDGTLANNAALQTDYNELPFIYDGKTESDPRIHIKATKPCTILALTYGIEEDNPFGKKE